MQQEITETLVSFRVAKLAKEKGFDVTVPQGYNSEELDYQRFGLPKGIQFGICTNTLPTSFTAPTQSLLQKYLREKHNKSIKIDDFYFEGKLGFDYNISELGSQEDNPKGYFDTYEEALEEALFQALNLLPDAN